MTNLDNQYFLVINQLNLFPKLNENITKMLEQVINAIFLNKISNVNIDIDISHNNIQYALNDVVSFELHTKSIHSQSYEDIISGIQPMLTQYGINIVRGEQVRGFYPRYHNTNKFYNDVGKQSAIDLEFSLLKKISYDGKTLKFESTYIDYINDLINKQRQKSQYNPSDLLIFRLIEPLATLKHVETRQIIEEQSQKYIDDYKVYLANLRERAQ